VSRPAHNRISSIEGQRFGRLVAMAEVEKTRHGARRWRCSCDCGGEAIVGQDQLRQGRTKSCGCLQREVAAATPRTHGGTGTAEHGIWRNMVNRCHLPTSSNYENYGARGIIVAKEWRGPGGFERWLAQVGPRPSKAHTIERIANDRGYEPGNVRWATDAEQRRNKRASIYVEWNGRRVFLKDLAKDLGVSYFALRARLRRGSPVAALVA
jgi:hypothetical protein